MKKRNWGLFLLLFPFLYGLIGLSGCSSSSVQRANNAEEVFKEAMEEFKDEDWEEAAKLFDIIKLQYPASTYADDAQYYLAEINFKKEEYVLSAFNYSMLRRIYPNSQYFKEAMYKSALSYFNLSPDYDRDQEYTYKAIDAFQEFQRTFPNDSLYPDATSRIMELRDKLANREYFTAELYRKIYSPKSAIIYYDNVINDFPDTKFYEPSVFGKIEVHAELKQYEDMRSTIELYRRLFPNGKFAGRISDIEQASR